MDTRVYWIWLQAMLGAGSPHTALLINEFTDAEAVYQASGAELKHLPIDDAVKKRLLDKNLDESKIMLRKTLETGGWIVTLRDGGYPAELRGIYAPPLMLYGRGNLPDFRQRPAIAVVGSREPSQYGYMITMRLAAGLTAGGAVIVSGGAVGIDGTALEAALRYGGSPVSVQACGLDIEYPKANIGLRKEILKSGGCLFSEYPPGTSVGRGTFHVRNRLISGMCRGVCVPEAGNPSGALITAHAGRDQGKDVFAVPGAVTSPVSAGTHQLIQEGARLVATAREILQEYCYQYPQIDLNAADRAFWEGQEIPPPAPPPPKRKTKPASTLKVAQPPAAKPSKTVTATIPVGCPDFASEDAKTVYEALKNLKTQPAAADDITEAVGFTMARTLASLTELELFGCVANTAGQKYSIL